MSNLLDDSLLIPNPNRQVEPRFPMRIFLFAQLEMTEEITRDRLRTWNLYRELLEPLAGSGSLELPSIPAHCEHNGHIFYVKTRDEEERTRLISFLKGRGVHCVFHYIPLHTSPAGLRFGRFQGEDRWTTRESERLLRLPIYYRMKEEDVALAARALFDFYGFDKSI